MKKFFKHVFILLFVSLSLVAQSGDSLSNVNQVVDNIELTDIPQHIKTGTEFISNVNNNFDEEYTIAPIRTNINTYTKEFDSLKAFSETVELSKLSYVKVREFDFYWEDVESRTTTLETSINQLSEKIDSKKKEIDTKVESNASLIEIANQEKSSNVLVANLNDINKELNSLSKKLESSSGEILNVLVLISEHHIFLTLINEKIDETLKKKQGQIFSKDSKPFWALFTGITISNIFSDQTNNVVGSYYEPLEDFLEEFSEQFLFDILLLVLIIFSIIFLKKILKGVELSDNENNSLIKILKRPFEIAFLFYVLILTFSYENLPWAIKLLAIALLIISLLRILFTFINPKLKTPLIIFSLIYFSQQLVLLYSGGSLFERVALLILPLLLILQVKAVSKKKKLIPNYEKKMISLIIENVIRGFYLVLSLSVITNIFGYVSLSKILLNGAVISIVASILLSTNVLILQSLILWFSKTEFARKFNTVRSHSNIILIMINKIITLIGFLLLIGIVLRSFSLYEIFDKVLDNLLQLDFGIGSLSINLYNLLLSIFIVWLSVLVSRGTKIVLEKDIFPRVKLPRGIPGTVTSLSRYTILSIGIFTAFISVGLDLSKFTLLAGALGVGIGFGLQDLVNNFIAGILLIFERPIQVGDVIELDSLTGTVESIGIRTSIVRTFDGSDVIIPNGQLVSSRLTNWTFSDTQKRIEVKVGVQYGTDINKVISILEDIASAHKDIFKDPKPTVLFHNFGNSSLDFELRCWTYITNDWLKIKTDLFVAVNNKLNEEGISIPFPQQDIHIIKEENDS